MKPRMMDLFNLYIGLLKHNGRIIEFKQLEDNTFKVVIETIARDKNLLWVD